MKEIHLTQGYVALVDDDDYEYLNQFKWQTNIQKHTAYAHRIATVDGKRTTILMARELMGLRNYKIDPIQVDHVDHNGLNNQKMNLRLCTGQQNCGNTEKRIGCKHEYKGIRKGKKLWQALIGVKGRKIYLGSYNTKEEAAIAYNKAALEIYGEFANINIMWPNKKRKDLLVKPKAIGYRIIVELPAVEETTAGGIIITSSRKETDEICCTVGTVVDIGEFAFCNDDGGPGWPRPWYAVGDKVIFAEHSGRLWKDEDTGINYRIMNDRDVLSRVE